VILVDTLSDLVAPDPTPSQLVPVATLIEENIAVAKPKLPDLSFSGFDHLHLGQVEMAALYICDAKIGNGANTFAAPTPFPLRQPALYFRDVPESDLLPFLGTNCRTQPPLERCLKHGRTISLEFRPHPLQRGDGGVEPSEVRLEGFDDAALLSERRERQRKLE